MTTFEFITELEKRAGYDEVSRAALGFIQKTIGICNSLPNGQEILNSITLPKFLGLDIVIDDKIGGWELRDKEKSYSDTFRLYIDKDENWKLGRIK